MIVKQIKDLGLIKKVLCHPEIYDRITDDFCPPKEEFEPPLEAEYIAGFVGNDIIGLMVYHNIDNKLKCHIQVLPEFREHSKEFARMALGEAKNASIYADIPICYPEVIKFAQNFGFKVIGSIPDGHVKNGEVCDVLNLRWENGIC